MTTTDDAPPDDPGHRTELDPLADLLEVLDLQRVGARHIEVSGDGPDARTGSSDATVFQGRSQPMPHGRVFGGQVLAQCLMAAGLTVEAASTTRLIHSLHGYFLRPGDSEQPIRFTVENMRDGRSFSARRVHAVQEGRILLSMITSFQDEAGGLDHHDAMPDVPEPTTVASDADVLNGLDDPRATAFSRRNAIDLRHVDGEIWSGPSPDRSASQRVWLRAVDALPDDPLLHAAVMAYASDYSLLESVLRRHGISWADGRLRPASLDHAMWFHRRPVIDDWVLYDQASPSAQGGRGLATGRVFARNGRLLASVAQEGMVRIKE